MKHFKFEYDHPRKAFSTTSILASLPQIFPFCFWFVALARSKHQQLDGGRGWRKEGSQGTIYLKGHNLHSFVIFAERLLSILLSYWVDKKFRTMGFILLNTDIWFLNIQLRDKEQFC